MAIEKAPYIGGLNRNIPANTDSRAEGAGQIRAIKTALQDSFPNVNGEVTATHTRMNEIFQQSMALGMIMMFGGTEAPPGWAFCDGNAYNGYVTPDLRSRFIMGWDPRSDNLKAAVNVGNTGGKSSIPDLNTYLEVDDHVLTLDEIAPHNHFSSWGESSHGSPYGASSSSSYNGSHSTDGGNPMWLTGTNGGKIKDGLSRNDPNHTKPENFTAQGHNHKLSVAVDQHKDPIPFDNRPAWYALAFIMYVGFEEV